ncbi:MAG: hypothetical protein HRT77_15220 [Halioglobus sp.]|nr:hypothetical protein [Halioglobus sp.]
MNCHPFSTPSLVLGMVVALISSAGFAQSFTVSQSITVSGATSGSGSGSGTATLDTTTGTLTMNLTTTTVTGFTDTTTETIATITGVWSPDSLSGVSGNGQLINCTNNGGLVNGCGSVGSDFGTDFITDPINFDLSNLGVTNFTVQDTNTGATIQQSITLIAGGSPPPPPPPDPVTIDLTLYGGAGPAQYTFDPGNGNTVTLSVTVNSGDLTQGLSGLGNDTGILDDGALDNYWTGASREIMFFTFSEPVNLNSVRLDLFEPIALPERAELSLDGGPFIHIDENNASRTGLDLSNWEYVVDTEVTTFTIRTPDRGEALSTFRINSLVVSTPPPVDSDGDGLTDDVETNTGLFVNDGDAGTDPNNPDSDGDGILDGAELAFGTDPTDSDSDNDGVDDGAEIDDGSDPTVSQFPCDVDPVAGLSLGDLLLLQQHLMNARSLSANEQVFCDIDLDLDVSLSDFQALQQQLLRQ